MGVYDSHIYDKKKIGSLTQPRFDISNTLNNTLAKNKLVYVPSQKIKTANTSLLHYICSQ